MTNLEYIEARNALIKFSGVSRKFYGDYAYATGFYEGLLLQLLEDATEAQRHCIIRQLERVTEDQERKLIMDNLMRDDETTP